MSQQVLDLRTTMHIVWRHRFLVGVIAAVGLLAGAAYAVLRPPMLTSTALVVLPQSAQSAQAAASGAPDAFTATQKVIADSSPVLLGALPDVRPAMSLNELRHEVQIGSMSPFVISVSAKGKTAASAEGTANAVADSYVHYISSSGSPMRISARLLQSATSATRPALPEVLAIEALIGAVIGALIGTIISLAIGRHDRRLRERDQIANSIGVPVLASFPVRHPKDAAGWIDLLEDYKPRALDAWRMRQALHKLRMADIGTGNGNPYHGSDSGSCSLAILSLSSDLGAQALGPQLAVFAASLGIPTALVIGPQQDEYTTATLRTACASLPDISSKRPGNLRVIVADGSNVNALPDAALTLVVAVVDDQAPRVPDTMPTTMTVLGVSAGATTGEQMARAAVSAAADGREISGIFVADPELTDHTTGLIPQLAQPRRRRLPTRLNGITTELRL
jgi:capsular polysaccharide biosynthesis protein